MIPAGVMTLIGGAFTFVPLIRDIGDFGSPESLTSILAILMTVVAVVLEILVFLELTAFFALTIRWGYVVLALICTYFMNTTGWIVGTLLSLGGLIGGSATGGGRIVGILAMVLLATLAVERWQLSRLGPWAIGLRLSLLLLWWADPAALNSATAFSNAMGPMTGQLGNRSDQIQLLDNSNRIMNSVDYGDRGDWPVGADGSGASLAKRDQMNSSELPENWTHSTFVNGTPGADNFPGSNGGPSGKTWYVNRCDDPPDEPPSVTALPAGSAPTT